MNDAVLAVSLGATAVGFVFTPSRRSVSTEFAAGVGKVLPKVARRIGVVVNPSLDEAVAIADAALLTDLQFHGHESPVFLAQLRALRPDLGILKALDVDESLSVAKIETYSQAADVLLFDAPRTSSPRKALDISLLKTVLESSKVGLKFWIAGGVRFWIAGGLNAQNVAEHVVKLRPSGVDVASAVEDASGFKSEHAMRNFIAAAIGAFHERN